MLNIQNFHIAPPIADMGFSLILQGWYTPLLRTFGEDDEGTSAMVTLGLTGTDVPADHIPPIPLRTYVLNAVNHSFQNMNEFRQHLIAAGENYKRKNSERGKTFNKPDHIIIPHYGDIYRPAYLRIPKLKFFDLELIGISNGNTLVNAALPYIDKITFQRPKGSKQLLDVDKILYNTLHVYPEVPAYALTIATASVLLWAARRHLLERPDDSYL